MGNNKSISFSVSINLAVVGGLITAALTIFKFISEPLQEIKVHSVQIEAAQKEIGETKKDVRSLQQEVSIITNVQRNR